MNKPHASVLTGYMLIGDYYDMLGWLQDHLKGRYRVADRDHTGIRTILVFHSHRDKFLFDIVWAKFVDTTLDQQANDMPIVEQILEELNDRHQMDTLSTRKG